jgi:hypothetical protein
VARRGSPTGFLRLAPAIVVVAWIVGAGTNPDLAGSATSARHDTLDPGHDPIAAELGRTSLSTSRRIDGAPRVTWVMTPARPSADPMPAALGVMVVAMALSTGLLARGRSGRGPPVVAAA